MANESGQGEWLAWSERANAAAENGVSSGGRWIGGLRLWKVFAEELKPLFGLIGELACWSMFDQVLPVGCNENMRISWNISGT